MRLDIIAVSLFGWSKQIQYKSSPNIRRQDPNNYSDTEMRALSKCPVWQKRDSTHIKWAPPSNPAQPTLSAPTFISSTSSQMDVSIFQVDGCSLGAAMPLRAVWKVMCNCGIVRCASNQALSFARKFIWAEQGERVAKEELNRGWIGREETRKCFFPAR